MVIKQKRTKGVPVDWNEIKRKRTLNLTDSTWDQLQLKADVMGISRSEVIERIVRGLIQWA